VVVTLAAVSWLASPAFACKNLVKFPEHLWGSTVGWWEPYRVVEISEARDDDFVVVVKQNFGSKSDVGKRTMLRFIANEEAYALCPISLVVGGTYLVRSKSSTEALLIQRFNHLNLPSGHPLYGIYLRDLEKAEVRPMYSRQTMSILKLKITASSCAAKLRSTTAILSFLPNGWSTTAALTNSWPKVTC